MITRRFEKELHNLKMRILSLGALVENCVRMTLRALESWDGDLSSKIVGLDCEIDRMEVEVEEECLKLLALYHPVAVDLRFLIAIIKMNSDLERIADEAVDIAVCVLGMSRRKNLHLFPNFSRISGRTESILSKSLDSLVKMDVELALKVCVLDRQINRMHSDFNDKLREMTKECSMENLMDLFIVARCLKRIADHATNIAEEVIYLVEGRIVRHRIFNLNDADANPALAVELAVEKTQTDWR